MHLMYEWENERHIPATWASDGEEICHYDPRLSTNNSSLSFAYPTIPLWILGLCSWVPTMYQNGTVYGRREGNIYQKTQISIYHRGNSSVPFRWQYFGTALQHTAIGRWATVLPKSWREWDQLWWYWYPFPVTQDALILVDRNISVTPNHGPEKTSERFGMCCKCGRTGEELFWKLDALMFLSQIDK